MLILTETAQLFMNFLVYSYFLILVLFVIYSHFIWIGLDILWDVSKVCIIIGPYRVVHFFLLCRTESIAHWHWLLKFVVLGASVELSSTVHDLLFYPLNPWAIAVVIIYIYTFHEFLMRVGIIYCFHIVLIWQYK